LYSSSSPRSPPILLALQRLTALSSTDDFKQVTSNPYLSLCFAMGGTGYNASPTGDFERVRRARPSNELVESQRLASIIVRRAQRV
jgi:hypothetical protein